MRILAVAAAGMLAATSAYAAPVVFTGFDAGAASLAAAPNATAAAALFGAAAGSVVVTDFESVPTAFNLAGPTVSITSNSGCAAALCGYNTTAGGSLFALQLGNTSTFSFNTPISAFGAYFTGWQVGSQTITYADGSEIVLTMPDGHFIDGGTLFFGFLDVGASITSITYSALNDIVAIDDVMTSAVIPLPATLPLLAGALFGLGLLRRRRPA